MLAIATTIIALYTSNFQTWNQRRVLRNAVTQWQEDWRQRRSKALKRLSKDFDEEILSL